MGGLKVWDGTQWVLVSRQPGPQGPVGDVATLLTPAGIAGGDLQGRYPNPEVKRVPAGTLLDVQRDISTLAANWYAITNGAYFDPALTYRPEVNVWWDVYASCWFNKQDAVYNYSYLRLELSPADMDGLNQGYCIDTQHSTVQTNSWRIVRRLFRLAAGTTYTAKMQAVLTGTSTSWQYHTAAHALFIEGKVWAQ
jgi:hypothetical protein